METNFLDKFMRIGPPGSLKENFSSLKIGTMNTATSSLQLAMSDLYALLAQRTQMGAELLPALSFDTDTIPDLSDVSPDLLEDQTSDFISEISEETADVIVKSLTSVSDFSDAVNGESNQRVGTTVTSAEGYAFDLIVYNGLTIGDGIQPLVVTTDSPVDTSDCLIFSKDNKYYCNSLVKSKGYYRPGAALENVYTIHDAINSLADWGEFEVSANTIVGKMQQVTFSLIHFRPVTLKSCCVLTAQRLSIEYDESTTIFEFINLFRQYYYDEYSSQAFGVTRLLQDIIHDLMVADTLNNVLMTATDLVRTGSFSVEAFTSSVQSYAGNLTASTQRLVSSICASYSLGGIYGASKYICNYLKGGSEVTMSEDGQHLVLTDNSSLVTEEYIAGLVGKLLSSAVSVVGFLFTLINPIIGALFMLGGFIIDQVVSIPVYDYNNATRPQVLSSDQFDGSSGIVMPFFPHGMWQGQLPLINLYPDFKRAIEDSQSCAYIIVPGGVVLFGLSPASDDAVSYEFHPAMCDFSERFPFGDLKWIRTTRNVDFDSSSYSLSLHQSEYQRITRDDIKTFWNSAIPMEISTDGTGLVDSDFDDLFLRFTLLKNASLFSLWAIPEYSPDNDDGLYQILFELDYEYPSMTFTSDTVYPFNPECFDSYSQGKLPFNPLFYLIFTRDDLYNLYTGNVTEVGTGFPAEKVGLYHHFFVNVYDWDGDSYLVPTWDDAVAFANSTIAGSDVADVMFYNSQAVPPFRQVAFPLFRTNPMWTLESGLSVSRMCELPPKVVWGVNTPKYNKSTFWKWVAITVAITAAALVVAVVARTFIRKRIKMIQARNSVKTEKAWDTYKNDPTTANYKAYKSAAFKNNIFASMTGGTKYSTTNYWNASTPATSGSTSGLISSAKAALTGHLDDGQLYEKANVNLDATDNASELITRVIHLIKS